MEVNVILWRFDNSHWATVIDPNGWTPERECKILGYIEIMYSKQFEMGSLHMAGNGGVTIYVFKENN